MFDSASGRLNACHRESSSTHVNCEGARARGAGLADAKIKEQLANRGNALMPMTSEFDKLIAGQAEKWRRVVKFAGIPSNIP